MSTIKVNSIKNTSTDDGGIAIDNSGHVQIDGQQLATAGALSNRNLVDNGAMVIAQRGTSESGLTNSPAFVVDRFSYRRVGSWGTNSFTMSQQSSGAPGGFTHFLRLAQSGTAAAPPADTACKLSIALEGFDTAQAGFGTSAAKDITLSFYAKGSVAGTYCVALQNDDTDQSYVAEYSLTTSWTRFQITIPARTTGTWQTDTSKGFDIYWTVAADSDSTIYGGSAGWNTANARWTSNQIETFASTSGATFDLCGVQLELGEVATPFEHRSFGDELARCQRYYQRASASSGSAYARCIPLGQMASSSVLRVVVPLNPTMRAQPSFNQSGTFATQPSVGTPGLSIETSSSAGGESATLIDNSSISGTSGNAIAVYANNDDDAFMEFSAEL